jgi:hypothetical protein
MAIFIHGDSVFGGHVGRWFDVDPAVPRPRYAIDLAFGAVWRPMSVVALVSMLRSSPGSAPRKKNRDDLRIPARRFKRRGMWQRGRVFPRYRSGIRCASGSSWVFKSRHRKHNLHGVPIFSEIVTNRSV